MVVTVDAQLFYSVLQALPYLVNYPYECTEQTLNRFVSTGIVSSLFRDYPAVAKMAEEMSKRGHAPRDLGRGRSRTGRWRSKRRRGSRRRREAATRGTRYRVNVLDPRIAKAEREAALAKLAQGADGGRRLSVVAGRPAVALHDALHPPRLREGAASSAWTCRRTWSSGAGPTAGRDFPRLDTAHGRGQVRLGVADVPQLRRSPPIPTRAGTKARSTPATGRPCSTFPSSTGRSTRRT